MEFQVCVPTIVLFNLNYIFIISSYVCTYTFKLIHIYQCIWRMYSTINYN